MEEQGPDMPERCERCQTWEDIPTYQYLKFDGRVHTLCGDCWELFRRWFFQAQRIEKDQGTAVT